MMWIGEHLLAYGIIHTPEEIERRIEAVTPEQIQSIAAEMFRDNRLSAAVITATKEERAVEDLLSFS
jgi:predicted Zn-dependent peptidase